MRGLLVVNPKATTTNRRVRDVLMHALADQFNLAVAETRSRHHGYELGRQARAEGMDCVVAFGGDGTINEVVNGLLAHGPGEDVPAVGVVPGGSANVFCRSLGFPSDPVEATGELIAAIREQRTRLIGLGRVDDRWMLCNAGLGVDAEIIQAMEAARRAGKRATPVRYLSTTIRRYFATERREPSLVLHRPGEADIDGLFLAIIQNTSPWTYLGALPLNPSPRASYDTGLEFWGLRSLALPAALRYGRRMLSSSSAKGNRNLVSLHDQSEFSITASPPTALQIDGEGLGKIDGARFRSVPGALRVYVGEEPPDDSSELD